MKLKKQTETEYVIQERTSLKGNPGDICNLNIDLDLYSEIKKLIQDPSFIDKVLQEGSEKAYELSSKKI